MQQIQAQDPTRKALNVRKDNDPDICPICHHSIVPTDLSLAFLMGGPNNRDILEKMYRCPREKCGHLFISRFAKNGTSSDYLYTKSVPQTAKMADIAEEICELSPNFKNIFNQAITAESIELDEVCGVALRKALEFLIKDYCVYKNPDKEDEIKRKFLGKCIQEFIEDIRIKQCAERATWLGNDETHYIRKWDNHDIEDLKLLIRLVSNWITNDILTEKYLSQMPKN